MFAPNYGETVKKMPWYSKKRIRHFTNQEKFHNTIIGLVIFDLLIVFVELIIAILSSCSPKIAEGEATAEAPTEGGEGGQTPTTVIVALASCVPTLDPENPNLENAKTFLFALSVAILCVFTVEIAVNIYAKGFRLWSKSIVSVIDAIIVVASLGMELGFKFSGLESSGAGGAIVVLRVWKIVRAMHAVAHSIEMRNQHVIHAIKHAMKSTNSLTIDIVKVYSTQRREFFRLHSKLLEAAKSQDSAAIPSIATSMTQVFYVIDQQLDRMRKSVAAVQEEEMGDLLSALHLPREEMLVDDDSDSDGKEQLTSVEVEPAEK
ncbi:hypothetical protein HDU93_004815 [Gonapodya sp. JEL0774]|nr:hypothetical protein HDU93_004815 [Gonapodya sp. JEL0774]